MLISLHHKDFLSKKLSLNDIHFEKAQTHCRHMITIFSVPASVKLLGTQFFLGTVFYIHFITAERFYYTHF